jgi:hypothetical protein
MCRISNKIKFCSCEKAIKRKLDNYWVLFRFDAEKNEFLLGEPVMPTSYRDPDFFMNSATLLNRLNESDAFDFPISIHSKDKILIVIKEHQEEYSYTYQYIDGCWQTSQEDPFDLMNHFKKIMKGNCEAALEN